MWRKASATDDQSIIEMSEALFREDPSAKPVPRSHTVRTLSELRGNPVRGIPVVLDSDSDVVGYALLISFWSNELGGEVCYIDELYVKASFRGQGCGAALVDLIFRSEGVWPRSPVAIELEVTPRNSKARELYLRLGFHPVKNTHMRLSLKPL